LRESFADLSFGAISLGRAHERGETGFGIKSRPAEPVDRAVAVDEGGCLQVADQGIVFDAGGHGAP